MRYARFMDFSLSALFHMPLYHRLYRKFLCEAVFWLVIFLLATCAIARPAHAQNRERSSQPQTPQSQPTAAAPHTPPPSESQLFESLAQATTPQAAALEEARILARWQALGHAPARLLVQRATLAVFQHRKPELAIELLDRATAYQPEWTESWVLRALIFKNMGDEERAMLDLRHVLAREPRHFMALSQMGAILIEQKQWNAALKIYRQVAVLNPQREGLAAIIDKLVKRVEGKAL
jgi:tetratricopeptide (TPR) repeat protein